MTTAKWNPLLHPRGRDGKFIEKFSSVRWLSAGRWLSGVITHIDPNTGAVTITRSDNKKKFVVDHPSEVLYSDPSAASAKRRLPNPVAPLAGVKVNVDGSVWQKVGGQGGSNPGGMFVVTDADHPDGQKYYVKQMQSMPRVLNELLANRLYALGGVGVADMVLDPDNPDGRIASRVMSTTSQTNLDHHLDDPKVMARVREGFILDAWLANWDVIGLDYDNIVVDQDGIPWRIDTGGALRYRAMGAPKGGKFGSTAGEFDTMRETTRGSIVFGSMTDEDLQRSAAPLAGISPATIRKEVADMGLDSALADTLIARRQDLLDRVGLADPFDPHNDATADGVATEVAAAVPEDVAPDHALVLNQVFKPTDEPEEFPYAVDDAVFHIGKAKPATVTELLPEMGKKGSVAVTDEDGKKWKWSVDKIVRNDPEEIATYFADVPLADGTVPLIGMKVESKGVTGRIAAVDKKRAWVTITPDDGGKNVVRAASKVSLAADNDMAGTVPLPVVPSYDEMIDDPALLRKAMDDVMAYLLAHGTASQLMIAAQVKSNVTSSTYYRKEAAVALVNAFGKDDPPRRFSITKNGSVEGVMYVYHDERNAILAAQKFEESGGNTDSTAYQNFMAAVRRNPMVLHSRRAKNLLKMIATPKSDSTGKELNLPEKTPHPSAIPQKKWDAFREIMTKRETHMPLLPAAAWDRMVSMVSQAMYPYTYKKVQTRQEMVDKAFELAETWKAMPLEPDRITQAQSDALMDLLGKYGDDYRGRFDSDLFNHLFTRLVAGNLSRSEAEMYLSVAPHLMKSTPRISREDFVDGVYVPRAPEDPDDLLAVTDSYPALGGGRFFRGKPLGWSGLNTLLHSEKITHDEFVVTQTLGAMDARLGKGTFTRNLTPDEIQEISLFYGAQGKDFPTDSVLARASRILSGTGRDTDTVDPDVLLDEIRSRTPRTDIQPLPYAEWQEWQRTLWGGVVQTPNGLMIPPMHYMGAQLSQDEVDQLIELVNTRTADPDTLMNLVRVLQRDQMSRSSWENQMKVFAGEPLKPGPGFVYAPSPIGKTPWHTNAKKYASEKQGAEVLKLLRSAGPDGKPLARRIFDEFQVSEEDLAQGTLMSVIASKIIKEFKGQTVMPLESQTIYRQEPPLPLTQEKVDETWQLTYTKLLSTNQADEIHQLLINDPNPTEVSLAEALKILNGAPDLLIPPVDNPRPDLMTDTVWHRLYTASMTRTGREKRYVVRGSTSHYVMPAAALAALINKTDSENGADPYDPISLLDAYLQSYALGQYDKGELQYDDVLGEFLIISDIPVPPKEAIPTNDDSQGYRGPVITGTVSPTMDQKTLGTSAALSLTEAVSKSLNDPDNVIGSVQFDSQHLDGMRVETQPATLTDGKPAVQVRFRLRRAWKLKDDLLITTGTTTGQYEWERGTTAVEEGTYVRLVTSGEAVVLSTDTKIKFPNAKILKDNDDTYTVETLKGEIHEVPKVSAPITYTATPIYSMSYKGNIDPAAVREGWSYDDDGVWFMWKTNSDGVLTRVSGSIGEHPSFSRKFSDGTLVEMMSASSEGSFSSYSGEVLLTIPINDDRSFDKDTLLQSVSRGMEAVGVPVEAQRPPTQEDVENYVLNSLMRTFYTTGTSDAFIESNAQRDDALKKITGKFRDILTTNDLPEGMALSSWQFDLGNDVVVRVDPLTGYVHYELAPYLARAVQRAYKIRGIARGSGGGKQQNSINVVSNPVTTGIPGATMRWTRGVFSAGQSTQPDLRSRHGGQIAYFSKLASGSGWTSSSALLNPSNRYVVYLHPLVGAGSLHTYSSNGDAWGSRDNRAYGEAGNMYEYNFKDGIPLERIGFVVLPAKDRTEIIKKLRDQGITHVYGRPVEEIYLPYDGSYVTLPDGSKTADWKEISKQIPLPASLQEENSIPLAKISETFIPSVPMAYTKVSTAEGTPVPEKWPRKVSLDASAPIPGHIETAVTRVNLKSPFWLNGNMQHHEAALDEIMLNLSPGLSDSDREDLVNAWRYLRGLTAQQDAPEGLSVFFPGSSHSGALLEPLEGLREANNFYHYGDGPSPRVLDTLAVLQDLEIPPSSLLNQESVRRQVLAGMQARILSNANGIPKAKHPSKAFLQRLSALYDVDPKDDLADQDRAVALLLTAGIQPPPELAASVSTSAPDGLRDLAQWMSAGDYDWMITTKFSSEQGFNTWYSLVSNYTSQNPDWYKQPVYTSPEGADRTFGALGGMVRAWEILKTRDPALDLDNMSPTEVLDVLKGASPWISTGTPQDDNGRSRLKALQDSPYGVLGWVKGKSALVRTNPSLPYPVRALLSGSTSPELAAQAAVWADHNEVLGLDDEERIAFAAYARLLVSKPNTSPGAVNRLKMLLGRARTEYDKWVANGYIGKDSVAQSEYLRDLQFVDPKDPTWQWTPLAEQFLLAEIRGDTLSFEELEGFLDSISAPVVATGAPKAEEAA